MSAGSAGDAPRVVWERVRLEGFGRHADVRVELPAALGVWIAPNEAGKTTAVLGLVAVLWGLPHVQDATAFTWARFRSWGGGAHRGAVTLRAGEARFTVHRAFETHRVRVVAHESGGDRVVVDAVHNPNARRETTPYLPWLRATLGLTEADAVLATFVVAQGDLGGPRHALGADVQLLLAGAGGGGWVGARERLEEELRARTRRLRSLDAGFGRDGTVDRALEVAEARAAALEAGLEAGRAAADAFERAQVEVRATDGARREALAQRERWAAAVAAQRAWADRREAYARSLARRAELARSATAARDRVAEARDARAEAEAQGDGAGAAFAGADATAAQRLEAWVEAARAAVRADERLVQACEARDAAIGEAHRAVAAAFAAERSVPAPTRDWSAWVPVAPTGGGDGGGERLAASVAAAREACGRWSAALAAARTACARLAAVDAARAPLAAFDRFDPALGSEVRGYAARRDAWAQRLAEADAALAAARARVEGHAVRFGPVRALAPEVAAALRAFATAHERPDGSAAWRWLGAIGWAAAVGVGAGSLGAAFEVDLPPVAAWGAGAVAAFVWALALPRRPALRRARRAVAGFAARGALEEAATALGRPVEDDDARLELARRLEAYDALGADVERDEAELLALEERCATLHAGADAFDRRWAPWRRSLIAAGAPSDVDLGAAHAEWTRLTGERAVARERVRAAAAALGVDGAPADLGAAVAEDAPAATVGRDGAQVAAWARFQGGVAAAPRVGEVEAWLARVAAATWARWSEEAAGADALSERRRAAAERRAEAEAEAGRVVAEHERAVRREEDRAAASAAAARSAREAVAEALGPNGADAVARWGGDAEAALTAWRAHRAARAAADAAAGAARAHLAALGVEVAPGVDGVATPEGLRAGAAEADRRAEAAAVEAGVRLRAWRDLVAAHPDLPPVDASADAEESPPSSGGTGAGAAFEDARTALAEADDAVAAAEGRALAAREALARLQGSDPIDVAVAELELAETRRAMVGLRGERDALALALRTLDAAVEDFRGAHAERLQAAASGYFATFSGVEGRRVVLDEAFAAHVVEPGGDTALPAQLSQGARDQLSVALRLAVADLLAADVRLPLVFDDPFLNWDAARTARLASALRALARDRQVVVLSHRLALAEWGEALVVAGS